MSGNKEQKFEITPGTMRLGMDSVLTEIILKFFQLAFLTVTLSIVGAVSYRENPVVYPTNSTGVGPMCNGFYQTIRWADEVNYIKIGNETTIEGQANICQLAISAASIGIIIAVFTLFVLLLIALQYIRDFRTKGFFLFESIMYVSSSILITVTAAFMAVGYDRTCENGKCMTEVSGGLLYFPTRDQILAAVIFMWLAILPSAIDAGFVLKRYINAAFPKIVKA